MTTIVHAITPGDHYSPRTGSAIPTVVHGLASASARDSANPSWTHSVLIDATTYHPRYPSAAIVEYDAAPQPARAARAVDAALGRVGIGRPAAARAWQPLAEALSTMPPAIVLAHNAPALPRMLGQQAHAVVLYAHNDLLRTVGHREAARTLHNVAAIVCVSEDLAGRTADRLPAGLAARVHVVENGVDTDTFTPPADAWAAARRVRIMFIGRVVRDKGVDVLLRAAQQLSSDHVEYMIVGSSGFDRAAELTPYEHSLRELAKGTAARVTFEPFVDRLELPSLLRTADIFVAPSRWREPSGLTIGEAMATGVPVVASRVGGIPEVVGDAGILVDKDDPAALARALRSLIEDEGTRRRIGREARSRARQRDWHYSWSQLRAIIDLL